MPTDACADAAVHQLIHTGAARPVAWRFSYGRRGRPQAEGRAFFPPFGAPRARFAAKKARPCGSLAPLGP